LKGESGGEKSAEQTHGVNKVGKAEICKLQHEGVIQQEIFGLQISVNNVLTVAI
jgi:hypothetical protein